MERDDGRQSENTVEITIVAEQNWECVKSTLKRVDCCQER